MLPTNRLRIALLVLLIAALACNLPGVSEAPAVDATKIALEIQATYNAAPTLAPLVDATKVALEIQATNNAPKPVQVVDTTKVALEVQATEIAIRQTQYAAQKPTDQPPATINIPADYAAQIKNAKILVYEDAKNANLDLWVQSTLDLMGLKYVHVGDAIGDFMSHLNSSTRWDLIIVAAESRKGVQGEFWDVITPKVTNDKSALVVEMWYLSQIASGRIQGLTSKCGVKFQSIKREVDSIYMLDSGNDIFSMPNGGFSLTNYVGYWKDKGGDHVRLTGSGDATLLAGSFLKEKSRYGLITSCMEGRMILQTFSTHDYHREQMQMLWENYIVNTLTNHFKAIQ